LNNLQAEIVQLLKNGELSVKDRDVLVKLEDWRQHIAKKFAIDDLKNSPLG
jgi:hypothetical protein